MKTPWTVIVICSTCVLCLIVGDTAYLDLHGGNGTAFLTTIGTMIGPTIAGLAALFKANQANEAVNKANESIESNSAVVNKIEERTNGPLQAHMNEVHQLVQHVKSSEGIDPDQWKETKS